MDKLMVTWTPPEKATAAVQEYVVEWRELHPGAGMQPPLGWLWSPPYRLSALISGTQYSPSFSRVTKFTFFKETSGRNPKPCSQLQLCEKRGSDDLEPIRVHHCSHRRPID
jgi:hypothetical protein